MFRSNLPMRSVSNCVMSHWVLLQILDYLLPEMTNKRGTLVVVLAGYEKPMQEQIMAYNEGMSSRFPVIFKFPDYTNEQLLMVFRTELQKRKPTFRVVDDKYTRIAIRRWVISHKQMLVICTSRVPQPAVAWAEADGDCFALLFTRALASLLCRGLGVRQEVIDTAVITPRLAS